MDYPNDFDVPVEPHAKNLALTRTMAIWTCVLFLVIALTGGLVWWVSRSKYLDPVVIAINPVTNEWSVMGRGASKAGAPGSRLKIMQQYVVGTFAKRWFRVFDNMDQNRNLSWCDCDPNKCGTNQTNKNDVRQLCWVCCGSDAALFARFKRDIVPFYETLVASGETWQLDEDSIRISPINMDDLRGGIWQVRGNIITRNSGNVPITAYAIVARSESLYSLTFGFYVLDFNAYRDGAD